MSLPLTRRIARAALLVATCAAPVVGAAGTAGAVALPNTPELKGLSTTDGAGLGGAVNDVAGQATDAVAEHGGAAVKSVEPEARGAVGKLGKSAVPAARGAVGKLGNTAVPAARQATGKTTGAARSLVKKATEATGRPALPTRRVTGNLTDKLPLRGAVPTQGLPVQGLPTQGLPLL
ncbi:hypothetical protein [Streptomyces sp. TP-A0874]|uniref:hypothetical protein n=1 Tax=Streptomyces sp. TP-A0874 TaxID=549819 RepID=UPI0008532FF7|nr:hypothetical protein [Streptomyces sp. TP-A0874]